MRARDHGSDPVGPIALARGHNGHGARRGEVVNRARVAERGAAMATFTSIFDVARLVGAPAVGLLIDGFDYLVAFSAAAVVLVAGAFVYRWWDLRIDPATLSSRRSPRSKACIFEGKMISSQPRACKMRQPLGVRRPLVDHDLGQSTLGTNARVSDLFNVIGTHSKPTEGQSSHLSLTPTDRSCAPFKTQ